MGVQQTHQQGHTIESICEAMLDLRQFYPNAGAREMISLLFHEKGMSVAMYICFIFCHFNSSKRNSFGTYTEL
jgi:hypothetical protein